MAFTATFYQFAKKENSTAQPAVSTPKQVYSISIKAATSIQTPMITLNVQMNVNPRLYNYCFIPQFGRYYWVTDWTYDAGIWTASLRCDVLATYKSAIGTSSQYVKRAFSQKDPDIIDVYPRKAGSTIKVTSPAGGSGLTSSLSSMTYIIGITSASTAEATVGTTVYYALSYSDCKAFIAHFVGMSYATFTDISDNLSKWICNPYQWIRSVIVLPIPYSRLSGVGWTSASAIKFGTDDQGNAFSFNCSCYIVTSSSSINVSFDMSIPRHTDLDADHAYLKAEPFSNYSVIVPPFGKMQIPSAVLYSASSLYCLIRIDPITGSGTLYLSPDDIRYGSILIAEAQVGVSLPVDAAVVDLSTFSNTSSAVMSGIGSVANAMSAGLRGGSLADIVTSFADGAMSSAARIQTISNGGKLCDLGFTPQLFLEEFRIIGQDPTNYGYPLGQVKTISTLSGYVECSHAEIMISSATYDEMRLIEEYMNSGFFYE